MPETARCYWLLDVVGSYQHLTKVKHVPFQLWELTVNEDNSVMVTRKQASDMPVIIKQELPFTDFPLVRIKLYLSDGVVIVPSEY